MVMAGEGVKSGGEERQRWDGCLLSPETFLMKICMVGTDSGETDREDEGDVVAEEEEGMMLSDWRCWRKTK